MRKMRMVCAGFIDIEKAFNSGGLWQVLKMYDLSGKILNGIKSIHVNSLACVRVKRVKVSIAELKMVLDKVLLCIHVSSMCMLM